jgi:dual specificity tyrosine-phosphorylation-regulated kinase 2/3/4
VFELLSCNLYEFLKQNSFRGMQLDLVRRVAIQLLQALMEMQRKGIIHCDLKPENILLKEANKSGIKVIDFGSSCFQDNKMYTYIQVPNPFQSFRVDSTEPLRSFLGCRTT